MYVAKRNETKILQNYIIYNGMIRMQHMVYGKNNYSKEYIRSKYQLL